MAPYQSDYEAMPPPPKRRKRPEQVASFREDLFAARSLTALELLNRQRRRGPGVCLLGRPELPLSPGALTQLYGPAGAGKTQVALSAAVSCVLSGRKAVCVSLGSAGSGSVTKMSLRLRAMLRAEPRCNGIGEAGLNSLLSNVWLYWAPNEEELFELVQKKLPNLLRHDPAISLVLLDSIAGVFRVPEGTDASEDGYWARRAGYFFRISSACKRLSTNRNVSFLIVNEATAVIRPPDAIVPAPESFDYASLKPALGLSWSQCVNSSWLVTRSEHATEGAQKTRKLCCQRSPDVPTGYTVQFIVDSAGAHAWTNSEYCR